MTSRLEAVTPDLYRRIQWIQAATIGWMSVEAVVSLVAAVRAKSPALLAFGGDSAIELISAIVVLWRFRSRVSAERDERIAALIAGILLIALSLYVLAVSALTFMGYSEPKPSYIGIAILTVASFFMPWLARQKRRLSAATGSGALRADAAESQLCGYLSMIALAGLALHAFFGIGWADPAAALLTIPFIVWEGREAIRGKPCDCSAS